MNNNMNIVSRSVGTHDGTFHADEVTACALLIVFGLVDKDKIVRTRDLSLLDTCEYVCDVGGVYNKAKKRFDHHQSDYKGYLSSAGMVLQFLKETAVIDSSLYDFLNCTFVMGVDAHDNGLVESTPGHCTFSHVITSFVPPEYDCNSQVQMKAFSSALDFVLGFIQRNLEKYQYVQACRQDVQAAMNESLRNHPDYLVFDTALPWMDNFYELGGAHHPASFLIMPSGSHWKLRGIPPSESEKMKVKIPLPIEWAGLLGQDLKAISNNPGAIFCHKGRFIAVFETKQDALKAVEEILKTKKEVV